MNHTRTLICLCLLLTACVASPQERAALTANAQTAIAKAWTLTPSPTTTPTVSATSPPTDTPTITPSPGATRKPTTTPTFSPTPEPGRYYAADSSFSLIPPEGWHAENVNMDQPGLFGPSLGDFSPNLIFIQEQSTFPVDFYSAMVQEALAESLTNLEQISEDFLVTEEGQDYFRWVIENTQEGAVYRQTLYFFESGDWKLVVIYTRPARQGTENDAIVDEAINTLRYKR